MVTRTSKPGATYDDLLKVPESLVAEIVDGDLYASPRPAMRHSLASSALGSQLGAAFQDGRGGPGGWWILYEPEIHFGEEVLVPDFAGWHRERLPEVPDTNWMTLAPDWVCEVLSPSTERLDRTKKLVVYAREGVRHAWLVNPIARTVEILHNAGGRWTLLATHGGDDVVRAEPFDAVDLDLLLLWGESRPTSR